MRNRYIRRDRFDFEIGHLKQSPCETCEDRSNLPACAKSCVTIEQIQTVLASGISMTRSLSD